VSAMDFGASQTDLVDFAGYGVSFERADQHLRKTLGDTLAHQLAAAAVKALVDEAELTPKPALVDRRGRGAHRDLDLPLMRRSAHALRPGFVAMARAAHSTVPDQFQSLRETLGRIGRDTERTMLAVTNAANTHRGAIWVMGLLVAATAQVGNRDTYRIAATAAEIARHRDRFVPKCVSNGERVRQQYGVRGARGEAEDGFPHVVSIALPMLRQARRHGKCEKVARVDALLAIMASLDDTCVLHRGGTEALELAKRGAGAVLAAGGSGATAGMDELMALDSALLARNASPGGAADLLAAALFLDRIEWDDTWSIPSVNGMEK